MRKLIALALALALCMIPLVGCNGGDAAPAAEQPAAPADGEQWFIAVVSKGFQHQFWQTVAAGSEAAAAQYGVEITFDGPPSESDIAIQVDMMNAAIARNPAAIALAALDTQSLDRQLTESRDAGIPVIGFDSGVPDAPPGSIWATASTDNFAAGELAAESMFNEPSFNERIRAATPDNPVVIGLQSQDATGASLLDRGNGFISRMIELVNGVHPGGIEAVGHQVFAVPADGDVAVTIQVIVPPTTSPADAQTASQTLLDNNPNMIGFFVSNEASVGGILAATNDGTDLDRNNGRFSDLIVVGFDAGAPQKHAVRQQFFYGSVTQDPFMIGFLAVELAVQALRGEIENTDGFVDTGAKFYTHANMDEPDIYILLYD